MTLLFSACLFLLMCLVSVGDALHRRIPNALVIALTGTGALTLFWEGGAHQPWRQTWMEGIAGSVLALCALLPFYVTRVMGAGDVKLASALGLWVGWGALLPIWLISCLLAMMHGLWLSQRLQTTPPLPKKRMVPYGMWLSVSTLGVWIYQNYSGSTPLY